MGGYRQLTARHHHRHRDHNKNSQYLNPSGSLLSVPHLLDFLHKHGRQHSSHHRELSPPSPSQIPPTPVNNTPPRATYLLPNSPDISDPLLFAEIHRTISSCNYLLTRERRVVLAMLLNMQSNGDNASLRRMLSLDST